MKPNDIVMIYSSPYRCEHPEGQAKLVKLIEAVSDMEYWEVEFINQPDKTCQRLIKP